MNENLIRTNKLNNNKILDGSELQLLNSLSTSLDSKTKESIEKDLGNKYNLDKIYKDFQTYIESNKEVSIGKLKSRLGFDNAELVGVIQFILNLYGYKDQIGSVNNPSGIDGKFGKKTFVALKDFVSKRGKIDYVETKKQPNEGFDLILELDVNKPITQSQKIRLEKLYENLQKDKNLRSQVMNNLLGKFKIDSKLKKLVGGKTRSQINMDSVEKIFGGSKESGEIAALQMYIFIADFVNGKKHKSTVISGKLDEKTFTNLKNNIFKAPLYADLMIPDVKKS